MRSFGEAFLLTPDRPLSDVAAVVAGGVLRLHVRSALSCDDPGPEKSPNSHPAGLEVSDETVLSVHSG